MSNVIEQVREALEHVEEDYGMGVGLRMPTIRAALAALDRYEVVEYGTAYNGDSDPWAHPTGLVNRGPAILLVEKET